MPWTDTIWTPKTEVRMLTAESEMKVAEVAAVDVVEIKAGKTYRDYIVDICCWTIDAVIKTITFVITSALLMVGGALFFVIETIVKIVFGLIMLCLTMWIFGALFRICWMIWGPKDI